MSTTAAPSVAAEPLWFLANRAVVRVASRETEGRLSIVELSGARGDMPPLHVHTRDDEAFHVLAGELSLFVGASCSVARAGDTVLAPRGIPHVYRVDSDEARWLAIATPGGFDEFVSAVGEPAPSAGLPPAPVGADPERLSALAAAGGIEILGPPGTLPA
ncbi:MAG: cupin domain-containing protein [Solirubrobacteraceae bacterium]